MQLCKLHFTQVQLRLFAITLKFDFMRKGATERSSNLSYVPTSRNNGCRRCSIFHGDTIRIKAVRSWLNACYILCIPHLCIRYRLSSRLQKTNEKWILDLMRRAWSIIAVIFEIVIPRYVLHRVNLDLFTRTMEFKLQREITSNRTIVLQKRKATEGVLLWKNDIHCNAFKRVQYFESFPWQKM